MPTAHRRRHGRSRFAMRRPVSHDWSSWPCRIVVLDNGVLNKVTWEQREMEGDPMFPASQKSRAADQEERR